MSTGDESTRCGNQTKYLRVTNLSSKTTDEGLKEHLSQVVKQGKIQSVKIIKQFKFGMVLSEGYGFVEFDSVESATSAFRDVKGIVLDGHGLRLSLCDAKTVSMMDKPCTRLIVKNLPFYEVVDVKDLIQPFSPFGQLKSVRLPRPRFGVVDFVTEQEASNAKRALSNTYFHGRRLALEWADQDYRLPDRSGAKYMDQDKDTRPKKRQMLHRCSSSLRD
ncbi:unnamed protein product [Microthlaspi erraticum]|uniref:RRM domain-containing protein n=1 Tax=Microthlaspi erraticum TaxID=1685480 RepID=A0A6D2J299_9BRAS|nr:unnamed protein product [Microthlaspi erraticum]